LATSRVIQSGTTVSSNLALGFTGLGSGGLIGSSILGQGVAGFVLGKMVVDKESYLFPKIKKLKIYALARRYIKFPTWNLFSSFISTLRENILIFAFSKYFEASFLGFYFFARRLLLLPSSILISAFSDVFYQKISNIRSYTEIYEVAYRYFQKLFYLLTLPFIVFVFLLDVIIPTIFGEKWAMLSIYLLIMAFPIYFNLLVGHFSKILLRTNNQDVSFYFHGVKLVMLFLVLLITIGMGLSFLQVLVSVSIFEIFFILLGVVLIQSILKVKSANVLLFLLSMVLIGIEIIIYNKI
jgi:O-antigen/teichoic acid export membrane protein